MFFLAIFIFILFCEIPSIIAYLYAFRHAVLSLDTKKKKKKYYSHKDKKTNFYWVYFDFYYFCKTFRKQFNDQI